MAFILPEKILSQQLCSHCKQYLSCPPIKIYSNGEIRCGRCSTSDDEGTISAFENIAKNILFPCINRFEGCSKLLSFDDIKDHEQACKGMEIDCPICNEPNEKYLVVPLLHHFKMKHPQNILDKPKFNAVLDKEYTTYYIYPVAEKNMTLFLVVKLNPVEIDLMCCALTCSTENRKMPKVSVVFSGKDDFNHKSKQIVCEDIRVSENIETPNQQFIHFHVPVHLTQVMCNLIIDHGDHLMAIQEFFPKELKIYKKQERKLYIDKKLKELFCEIYGSADFKLSECGMKLVSEAVTCPIVCQFCENILVSSGANSKIYYDDPGDDKTLEHFICGSCYAKGVTGSLENNNVDLTELSRDHFIYDLIFKCKYGCKTLLRRSELLSHEDQCPLNQMGFLSDEDYVKSFFRDSFHNDDKHYKEDVIIQPNNLEKEGKIFIATRDNFKCIIKYKVVESTSRCNFHVTHDYDPNIYYIKVHIWEDQHFRTEYNDFSLKLEGCEGPSIFAVMVKEIEKEIEVFIEP